MHQKTQEERRQHHRFRCEGKAEIGSQFSSMVVWGTLTDLSEGGCYIEMTSPLPRGRMAKLKLTLGEETFAMEGMVAVVHPMFGMGVVFTPGPASEAAKLRRALSRLAAAAREASPNFGRGETALNGPAAAPAACGVAPAGVLLPSAPFKISPESACRILEHVVKHLAQKGSLSCADMLTILERTQS